MYVKKIFQPVLDDKGGAMPSLGHTSNLVSDHLGNIRYTSEKFIMQLINDS